MVQFSDAEQSNLHLDMRLKSKFNCRTNSTKELLVNVCSIPSITGLENLAGSSSLGKTDSKITCRSCVILSEMNEKEIVLMNCFALCFFLYSSANLHKNNNNNNDENNRRRENKHKQEAKILLLWFFNAVIQMSTKRKETKQTRRGGKSLLL